MQQHIRPQATTPGVRSKVIASLSLLPFDLTSLRKLWITYIYIVLFILQNLWFYGIDRNCVEGGRKLDSGYCKNLILFRPINDLKAH